LAVWFIMTKNLAHIVDDDVDALNIDTTTKDIGGDQDTLLEGLELLEPGDTERSAGSMTLLSVLQLTVRAGAGQSEYR
jgi:hypothetical protein